MQCIEASLFFDIIKPVVTRTTLKEVLLLFQVKRQEFITKTFRMPVALVERLEKLAQNKSVSLNQLIAQCCEYALDNLSNEDEQK